MNNQINKKTDEELYEEALGLLGYFQKNTNNCISISSVQRRLRIGYTTAARIVDKMEAQGYVSEWKPSKPRKILKVYAPGGDNHEKVEQ